jgi:hypothetical protein
MHMLVGLLLTRFLKHAHAKRGFLPHIRGKFEVIHTLPGRIRLRIPMLEGRDPDVIDTVEKDLKRLPEINSVESNPISASLVLDYNEEEINASIICGILLKLLELEDELDAQPQSIAQKELNLIGRSLNRQVYNSSAGIVDLNSALALTIFALGLYKIIVQRDRVTPSGFNLLWWAYIIFQRGNR